MSTAPAWCDGMVAALSEAGHPPEVTERGWASWPTNPPPIDVYRRALTICGRPDIDDDYYGVSLDIRTSR